jgi:hypothetical protein
MLDEVGVDAPRRIADSLLAFLRRELESGRSLSPEPKRVARNLLGSTGSLSSEVLHALA